MPSDSGMSGRGLVPEIRVRSEPSRADCRHARSLAMSPNAPSEASVSVLKPNELRPTAPRYRYGGP